MKESRAIIISDMSSGEELQFVSDLYANATGGSSLSSKRLVAKRVALDKPVVQNRLDKLPVKEEVPSIYQSLAKDVLEQVDKSFVKEGASSVSLSAAVEVEAAAEEFPELVADEVVTVQEPPVNDAVETPATEKSVTTVQKPEKGKMQYVVLAVLVVACVWLLFRKRG